jgi:hypothetical protein
MTPAAWAARFEKRVRKLQIELGLLDWCFSYKTAKEDGTLVAQVDMDRQCREAIFTAYLKVHKDSPERIALHEVLHVIFNEPQELAAERGNHNHRDVNIAEHVSIERLVNFICGRP